MSDLRSGGALADLILSVNQQSTVLSCYTYRRPTILKSFFARAYGAREPLKYFLRRKKIPFDEPFLLSLSTPEGGKSKLGSVESTGCFYGQKVSSTLSRSERWTRHNKRWKRHSATRLLLLHLRGASRRGSTLGPQLLSPRPWLHESACRRLFIDQRWWTLQLLHYWARTSTHSRQC